MPVRVAIGRFDLSADAVVRGRTSDRPQARLEPQQPIEIAWCLGPDPAALAASPLPPIGA